MLDKNATSPNTASGDALIHRIFRGHILAVILTGVLVLAVLVGFTKVPQALAVSLCTVAACSLFAFPYMTISRKPQRMEYIAVSVGLSLTQLIFILPVLACIFAPAVNFRTMLFG